LLINEKTHDIWNFFFNLWTYVNLTKTGKHDVAKSQLPNVKTALKGSVLSAVMAVAASGYLGSAAAEDAQIIELTQVNCQFVESENDIDHNFQSANKGDCEVIHDQSGEERLASSKTLTLKPGKYIFRVTNKDVEYPLGFYLRGDGLIDKARLPKVSGGGLETGVTKDYEITLVDGEYVYSCPLNSTLDYKLLVSDS